MNRAWTILLTVSCAWSALGQESPGQRIEATRASGHIRVDGRLDEPAWAAAPRFSAFVQRFPEVGAAPTEPTELRVLYDDRALYVAVVCKDSQPSLIARQLGRRDSSPASDNVQILIDGMHDHRTAYVFELNAGGVLTDGIWFDDRNFSHDWDGVWEGATSIGSDGWVAELTIPLQQLHFPQAAVQTWGFSVRRNILRKQEEQDTVLNPRSDNAEVSRMGHLTGLRGLLSRAGLELSPYALAKGSVRPQFQIDTIRSPLASPRLFDPSADVGVDFKANLTSDLTLNGTVNPDFGQVEADRLILNLSTSEAFFPEKRPFFTQGMERFQPAGGSDVPMSLFYSRRIGLDGAPIFAAAKLQGRLGRVQVGVLNALTMGASATAIDENAPDRRWTLRPERPLHLGLNDELAITAPPPTNFFVGVAQLPLGPSSRVGLIATSAAPMALTCQADQVTLDSLEEVAARSYQRLRPSSCLGRSGNAVAADFDLNSDDAAYAVQGQVALSQAGRTVALRVLRDGVPLRAGDLGLGAFIRVGKLGGDGLRWDVDWEYASPTLELNPTGFLPSQNVHKPRVAVRYVRSNGLGPLKAFNASAKGGGSWTTDGRHTSRGAWVEANVNAQLPSFDWTGFAVGASGWGFDPREVSGTGVAREEQGGRYVAAWFQGNPGRVIIPGAEAVLGVHDAAGSSPATVGWTVGVGASLRPHPAFDTVVQVVADHSPAAARFLTYDFDPNAPSAPAFDTNRFYFGDQRSGYLSLTVRQSVVLSPNLTIQGYAQLFSDYADYGPFYEVSPDAQKSPIRFSQLQPSTISDAFSFYETRLNVNAVLRWEYRPGSTLWAVYTRQQQGSVQPAGAAAPRTVWPVDLFGGPATDAFMLKWSYYWTV